MSFHSLEEIRMFCERKSVPFWKAVQLSDMDERGVTEEESLRMMGEMWDAMKSAEENYDGERMSHSGLTGGAGAQMESYLEKNDSLCGEFTGRVMAEALKMAESNACMQRIVAAPTAGACGVIPAVLLTACRERKIPEEDIVKALYTAAGIGQVVAERAFIAGAAGGCQAEVGTASAMAAGALAGLCGGDAEQIIHAVAMALKNLLGLVCDPVAGLVEIPCVKRNVIGAVNALAAADMALAGIESRIPADQVIDAMKEVGESMHVSLKETGEGGVANTPEADTGGNFSSDLNLCACRHRRCVRATFAKALCFG